MIVGIGTVLPGPAAFRSLAFGKLVEGFRQSSQRAGRICGMVGRVVVTARKFNGFATNGQDRAPSPVVFIAVAVAAGALRWLDSMSRSRRRSPSRGSGRRAAVPGVRGGPGTRGGPGSDMPGAGVSVATLRSRVSVVVMGSLGGRGDGGQRGPGGFSLRMPLGLAQLIVPVMFGCIMFAALRPVPVALLLVPRAAAAVPGGRNHCGAADGGVRRQWCVRGGAPPARHA